MHEMRLALPLALLLASTLLGCSGSSGGNNSPATGGAASSTGGAASSGGAGGSGGCTADLQSDPDNCGACGHSCLGGACDAGACQPLEIATPDQVYPSPGAVAADDDGIYFVGLAGSDVGALYIIPAQGGAPRKVAGLDWSKSEIFPTADHVYVYQSTCCIGTNTLTWDKQTKKAAYSGSMVGADRILYAWLGPKFAFFGSDNELYFDAPTDDVNRTELKYLPSPVVTGNSTWVFFATTSEISGPTNPIYRAKLSTLSLGATPKTSAWIANAPAYSALAANEEALFGATTTSIDRIDVSDGARSTIASNVSPYALGADEKDVYWLDGSIVGSGPTRLLAAPVTGGQPRVIAAPQGQLQGLWVDDRAIVWSTDSPNAVYLLAK